jgi:signal transduction histidine kinase
MSQVLTNIVLNARDAMIEGGPIDISVSALENAGNAFIEIEVRDSGPGMSEEIQSRVFEPFFTTKRSGNGLGLAISQRIVLRHGGAIEVDSCPGEGTTFRIQLPRL